ncbi:serine/threonine protein kinase, partial [candidate division CSSED10-310 bacterium]
MKRTRFGKYDLIEKIASGGMAEIFLAKQSGVRGFAKIVVIKRIHKHLSSDAEFVAMFINEARVAAQLTQQNIVQIYDFGEQNGSYYIAMEYIHGKDLKTLYNRCRMSKTGLPLELAIHIVQQLCNGLSYAHRKKDFQNKSLNIVHRDVSPQNVLISFEGEIKVTDFGIAKATTQLRATQAGTLKGKMAYMSPEQAWGKEIDQRSDIFAIGIIFYEILLSRRLFLGSSDLETLENVRGARKVSLRDIDQSIPLEIERIIHKALEKDVQKRYQNAREMYQELETFSVQNGFLHQPYRLAEFMRSMFLDKQPELTFDTESPAGVEEQFPATSPDTRT